MRTASVVVVMVWWLTACGAQPAQELTVEGPRGPAVESPALTLTLSPRLVAEGGDVVVLRSSQSAVLTREVHPVTAGTTSLQLAAPSGEALGILERTATRRVVRSRVQQAGCQAAPTTSSAVLRVPEDHPTIQAAVDAAQPGDTVKVGPGLFTESVHLRTGVALEGSGAGVTILDAQGQPRSLVDFTDAANVSISGFTFRGVGPSPVCARDVLDCSGNWIPAAIFADGHGFDVLPSSTTGEPPICPGSSAHISHNVFEDNAVAVLPYFHALAVVQNNLFVRNTHAYLANHLQDVGVVLHNTFVDSSEHAISITAGYVDVVNNVIASSAQSAMFQEYIQVGRVQCNLVFGRDPTLPLSMTLGAGGNAEADPRFIDPTTGDYQLGSGSPGLDTGCGVDQLDPDGTLPDLGAWGGPLGAW